MASWAAFFISIAVAIIAFLQWRTAHQKVVLDLFDRRMKVIDEVNDVIGYFWTNEGNLVAFNARRRLSLASGSARYLFGEEVATAIKRLDAIIRELGSLKNRLEKLAVDGPGRYEVTEKITALEDTFDQWVRSFPDLCLPYVKHDQRRVGTLREWFVERNRKRLSYGDQ
ncbi:hypothetical protein [Rhizobium sp. Root1220]|uniref:hypothetical protein n=1 Tax=Rhizobium sp. Root1220 TaxID=1736432 RepID=UPI0006FDAB34|nr:hypothetical protein [Rhizobium sp. Root1220]KQV73237.1 hypothetical protein ASC90_07500 [Rhizobium sp. Root1220]